MTSPLFAAIGHQPDWACIAAMIGGMRERERRTARPLTRGELASLMDCVPPRVTSRFTIGKTPTHPGIEAVYIETFIRPDELAGRPGMAVLRKVQQAIAAAGREGAQIATLGGFTSILVEAGAKIPTQAPVLTSGNSLTAALILRGVERALAMLGRSLADETVLVIGASGDIGSGVSRWLAGRCRLLLLAARNRARLETEAARLQSCGNVAIRPDAAQAMAEATVVIAAASTAGTAFPLDGCRPDTILCDAGYPKNLETAVPPGVRLFHGGMGRIAGGMASHDGLLERFYRFPASNVAHGCMLEGALLALAGRFEPFSCGRGRITADRIDEIWRLACAHDIAPAPLFNAAGRWPAECVHAL